MRRKLRRPNDPLLRQRRIGERSVLARGAAKQNFLLHHYADLAKAGSQGEVDPCIRGHVPALQALQQFGDFARARGTTMPIISPGCTSDELAKHLAFAPTQPTFALTLNAAKSV
ncbi:hypothetical protein MPLB_1870080 [Mesorhizobium sp. ORS 3324]|nr:hypothetical protein MPLB_1870080 [Mesorhizobium sp. ORS 3324]